MNALVMALGGEAGSSWIPTLISQTLAFAMLLFIIVKFGVPHLKKLIVGQTQQVDGEYQRLERETKEASSALADVQRRLSELDAESKRRLQAAVDEGMKLRTQALNEANAQAAAELAKIQRTVQIERDKAVAELRGEVVRLTLEATERTVDGLIDERLHGRMVEKYLDDIEQAAGKA